MGTSLLHESPAKFRKLFGWEIDYPGENPNHKASPSYYLLLKVHIQDDAAGAIELPFPCAFASPLCGEGAVSEELLDAVISHICTSEANADAVAPVT